MDRVRKMLHAEELHRAGITGKNVAVCILDSGICGHPDYADRILAFRDFINGKKQYYDDASHGSHVSGIIGGDGRCSNGRYCGIAPGCRLIHLKVLDRMGQGSLSNILSGIRWAIEHKDQYNIRVMNLSAGTANEEEDENARLLVKSVEAAWDAGIAVVVAAGNMGPVPQSITVPGNSRKVITVGSSDQFRYVPTGTANSNYSGCGPTKECICKPEIVAPGTGIVSCATSWRKGRYYSIKSGTSMAAPAIAGSIALLLEKEPELTNLQIKMRLKEAAVDLGLPGNRQGWGIVDLRKL